MAIMRVVKDKNYSVVHNGFILDKTISLKAKAVLLYCLSKPNDWHFYTNQIMRNCTDGFASVTAGIKELINAGYIIRERKKDEKGRFIGGFDYCIYEIPVKDKVNYNNNETEYFEGLEGNGYEPDCKNPNYENPNYDKPNYENSSCENLNYKKPNYENPSLLNTENILNTNNIQSTEALINTDKKLNTEYIPNTPPPPNTKEDVINKDKINTSGGGGGCNNKDIYNLFYEAGFGEVSNVVKEIIDNNILKYSKEAFKEATIEAIKNNKLKLSYIEGILKNNKAKGGSVYGKCSEDNGGRSEEEHLRESGLYLDLEDLL